LKKLIGYVKHWLRVIFQTILNLLLVKRRSTKSDILALPVK